MSAASALLAAAVAAAETAAVGGSCGLGATTVPLVDGLAYRLDGADAGGDETTVVFLASAAIDREALAWATQRERALRDQMVRGAASWVQLSCKDKRSCWVEARVMDAAGPHQQVFPTARGLKLDRLDRERVEGRLDNSFLSWVFDLSFALEVEGDAAPGSALPPGGGEAGAAYLTYQEAIRDGDLDRMLALVEAERAQALRLQIGEQPTPETVEALRASGLVEVEVAAGRADADVALLEVRGVDHSGGQRAGKVLMRREGEAWKVVEASLASRSR